MANRKKISKAQMQKNISAFCGIFKQKPGEKSVVQEHLEERRAEREKENREFIHLLRGKFKHLPLMETLKKMKREEKY
jgi:hypothetical protein